MTEDEKAKALVLEGLRYTPGSAPKRFAQSMGKLARFSPLTPISVRQWFYLQNLYHVYRAQIKHHDRYCFVCRGLKTNTPLIYMICPECGYRAGSVQKVKGEDDLNCPRCFRVKMRNFKIERNDDPVFRVFGVK